MEASRRFLLWQAAVDFYLFQSRGYPRGSSLGWVGNRYELTQGERDLLQRGVFGQKVALDRLAKRCKGGDWVGRPLVVDGHNVHITVESALVGRALLKGNDGALRDLAGLSSHFKMTEVSVMAIDVVLRFLEAHRPGRVTFLFDGPMSHSGELAAGYAGQMQSRGLSGEARAVPVPEREMIGCGQVLASSDRAVLDGADRWLDLACCSVEAFYNLELVMDFSPLIMSHPGNVPPLVTFDPS